MTKETQAASAVMPDAIETPGERPLFDSPTEALIVAQALYKSLAEVVSTKDAGSLRARCDEAMRDAYEADGTKSRALKLGGAKVGTYSVVETREVDAEETSVEDRSALERWAVANGFGRARFTVTINTAVRLPDLFERCLHNVLGDDPTTQVTREDFIDEVALFAHVRETGELPEGMEVRHVHAEPAYKGTRLLVDPAKVYEALSRRELPAVAAVVRAIEGAAGGDA